MIKNSGARSLTKGTHTNNITSYIVLVLKHDDHWNLIFGQFTVAYALARSMCALWDPLSEQYSKKHLCICSRQVIIHADKQKADCQLSDGQVKF